VLSKKELRRLKAKGDSVDDVEDEGKIGISGGSKNTLVKMFEKKHGWPDYVWLKGTAYDSTIGGKKKRNMNMNIQVPNFDLHIGKGDFFRFSCLFSHLFLGQMLLDNAELNIQYGTRYGIIGRNGIGKSVLLRAISSREGLLFFFLISFAWRCLRGSGNRAL
jgi:ABC-type multidrug transport system fused ATPase/permease subunit